MRSVFLIAVFELEIGNLIAVAVEYAREIGEARELLAAEVDIGAQVDAYGG